MNIIDSLDKLPSFLDQPAPTALLIPAVTLEPGQIDPRLSRLSYSSNLTLHSCPRKFQLDKLQAEKAEQDESTSVTFAYGHAIGEGIQQLLIHRTEIGLEAAFNTALWKMFLAWDADILAENH
jgi:hypothetical protein